MTRSRVVITGALLALMLGVSCGGGAEAPTPPTTPPIEPVPELAQLQVAIPPVALVPGGQTTARVVATDTKGRPMTVGNIAWSSSKPAVAIVGADGTITAYAAGLTIIEVRVGDVSGGVVLEVGPSPPGPLPVASVTVTPFIVSLGVGGVTRPVAVARDFAGRALDGRTFTWRSSNPTVATVSSDGVVTAVAAGTAVIEAQAESQHGAMALTVSPPIDSSILVTIPRPDPGEPVADTVSVTATTESTLPLARVVARIGAYEWPMGEVVLGRGGRGWQATVDLSSYPYGPITVVVNAYDITGARGVASVVINYNPVVKGGSKSPSGNK